MKRLLILAILPISLIAQTTKPSIDLRKIKAVVQSWTDAHNQKDIAVLDKLYAADVLFYTRELKKDACLAIKSKLLSASDFRQEITTDLIISVYTSGVIKCDFTKQVSTKSSSKLYVSYLLLRQVENGYSIVGESDLLTDRNLHYHLEIGEQLPLASLSEHKPIENESKTDFKVIGWVGFTLIILSVCLLFLLTRRRYGDKSKADNYKSLDNKLTYELMGKEFVAYVVRRFDDRFFRFKRFQSDEGIDGKFPLANRDPDLEFVFSHNGFSHTFAVECKYRTKLFKGKFEIERRKLKNYERFQKSTSIDVHIVLGLGGQPNNPNELYVVPLDKFIDTCELSYNQLKEFRKDLSRKFFYNLDLKLLT